MYKCKIAQELEDLTKERAEYYRKQGSEVGVIRVSDFGNFQLWLISRSGRVTAVRVDAADTREKAESAVTEFRNDPPYKEAYFHQRYDIKIKDTDEILSITV